MTNAAVFRATYSDFKLIKTRGVVSISFEVPLEQVDHAYQVLGGMPDVSAERWFAVAKLNEGATVAPDLPVEAAGPCGESPDRPHKPRKPVAADKRLAQQAGMLASDAAFNRYLAECHHWHPADGDAATFIRSACNVVSRSQIVPGSPAAQIWIDLESRFTAWKLAS